MWTYVGSLLVSGSAVYLPSYYTQLTTPIEEEEVVTVEERCCHLESSAATTVGGRHSYLVATTKTGRCVRFDYYPESQQVFTTTNYWELIPQELFRRSVVPPGIKVRDVHSTFQRHVWSQNYSPWSHNCQHVVLSTYNALTHRREHILRNDYILSFLNYLPAYLRKRFRLLDPEYAATAPHRKSLFSELRQTEDQQESLWRLMKTARFDLVAKLSRLSPGLIDKDIPLASGVKQALESQQEDAFQSLSQYEEELKQWEKTKN